MLDHAALAHQTREDPARLALPDSPDGPADQACGIVPDQQLAPVRQLIDLLVWALERELEMSEQGETLAVQKEDLAAAVINLKHASQLRSMHSGMKRFQYDWEELQL